MPIVTSKQIANVTKLDRLGFIGTFVSLSLMKLMGIDDVNKVYDKYKHLPGIEFLDAIIEEFGFVYEIDPEELKRLPKQGAYITVSNHPLGAADGIILLKMMLAQNTDYKIMANFLLQMIEPLKPYVLPVNPFESRKEAKSSVSGIKEALLHVKSGKPLGIFPAGEVSNVKTENGYIDRAWQEVALKVIHKSQVPVIPIYFHAKNSKSFYTLSKLSPTMQSAKLPSEMLSQHKRNIRIRIGRPISVEEQNEHAESIEDYGNFIRQKTYLLANAIQKNEKRFIKMPSFKIPPPPPQQIANPVTQEMLEQEINFLRENTDCRLLQSKNYEVFLAESDKIPNVLREIGRLREITFRAVGEGTNQAIDLDKYDHHYLHMFLWDDDTKKIAGAYRMGLGKKLFAQAGIESFYLHELFSFEPELYSMMEQSIEMGRAFIIDEYQQKPMPLFLLWKGIVHTTLRYPEHKYLIGGVSISNQFSEFSKSLMIEFMKSNYYDPYIAQYVSPRKEYKVKLKDADKDFIFNETEADLNKFDRLIDEVEPGSLRLPVLIKKYIKQNARMVAFNVDPLFNNAVDGLMYIRIADLPESTVKPVMEEFQLELEKKLTEQKENGIENDKV
ncbi:MAG TPA: lysophospholipid acyltransferase family protein [Flavobacterium sp.]|nr:lysophospholipid acyltransferase family protein [Flavobacterium sp.]